MARYDEAQADYSEFANIMGELGAEISGEELKLKKDLDCRTAAADNRDELMRAIDVSATSIHLLSQEKTKSHRFEDSSFGKITARHSPCPHSRY